MPPMKRAGFQQKPANSSPFSDIVPSTLYELKTAVITTHLSVKITPVHTKKYISKTFIKLVLLPLFVDFPYSSRYYSISLSPLFLECILLHPPVLTTCPTRNDEVQSYHAENSSPSDHLTSDIPRKSNL